MSTKAPVDVAKALRRAKAKSWDLYYTDLPRTFIIDLNDQNRAAYIITAKDSWTVDPFTVDHDDKKWIQPASFPATRDVAHDVCGYLGSLELNNRN